jgi:hypothetical protein
MARVSFTLRRPSTDTDLGSYLRYDDAFGVRTDYDSALRADGLQTAPNTFVESTFSASSVCYGEVELEWEVPIVEFADLTATPDVTEALLVYSAEGEPQTLASGTVLVESTDTFSYTHTGLAEGRWAYYTLFVHYQSTGGDSYYEKAASLSVLVPKDYGSTALLWKRIPEYYRNQDTSLGDLAYDAACLGSVIVSSDQQVGPLLKYLSIFGFEMDRMRTMLDYQMVSYDPMLSNSEHLDALAEQLGVGLLSEALGARRLRSLLNDIGVFRRSKGTASSIEYFGQALAGSDITVDETTGEIIVYSQRVNYITDPKDGSTVTTHRAAFNTEVTAPVDFSVDMSAYSGTYSVTGSEFSGTGTGASVGVEHVLLHLSDAIPVQLSDRVGFSVQSNIGTEGIKWVRLVNGAGASVGLQDIALTVDGARVFEVTVESNASAGVWTDVYVEYLVDLSAVPVFMNESLLAERNYLGTYFDGSTVRGGWLVDSSSVSDYRWEGSANASRSLFTEDYQRTKAVLGELLFYILPITEVSKYTIIAYNAIPGVPPGL